MDAEVAEREAREAAEKKAVTDKHDQKIIISAPQCTSPIAFPHT
jgi:hypothetical protein